MTKNINRKPIRRAKLAVALLAATAAFSAAAQTVAPATASAARSNCDGYLARGDFHGWVACTLVREGSVEVIEGGWY